MICFCNKDVFYLYFWHMLRATYNRVQKAMERIKENSTLAFPPMECKSTVKEG